MNETLLKKLEIYENALRFYASGKHIKLYIPDYLQHAMMPENSIRYVEEVVDRGEVATKALKEASKIVGDNI